MPPVDPEKLAAARRRLQAQAADEAERSTRAAALAADQLAAEERAKLAYRPSEGKQPPRAPAIAGAPSYAVMRFLAGVFEVVGYLLLACGALLLVAVLVSIVRTSLNEDHQRLAFAALVFGACGLLFAGAGQCLHALRELTLNSRPRNL